MEITEGEKGETIGGGQKEKKNRERTGVKGSNSFLKDLFESVIPKHLE